MLRRNSDSIGKEAMEWDTMCNTREWGSGLDCSVDLQACTWHGIVRRGMGGILNGKASRGGGAYSKFRARAKDGEGTA
jgi:hypothetical protein